MYLFTSAEELSVHARCTQLLSRTPWQDHTHLSSCINWCWKLYTGADMLVEWWKISLSSSEQYIQIMRAARGWSEWAYKDLLNILSCPKTQDTKQKNIYQQN